MGDASDVVREVGVNDFRVATEQQLFHLDHRLFGIAPGAARVLFRWEVGLLPMHSSPHPDLNKRFGAVPFLCSVSSTAGSRFGVVMILRPANCGPDDFD